MVELKTCELDGCDNAFKPWAKGIKRFCCSAHQKASYVQEHRTSIRKYHTDYARGWQRKRYVEDPERYRERVRADQQRMRNQAKAFRAMYEPVQTWWALIKDALENRAELPAPPIYEEVL